MAEEFAGAALAQPSLTETADRHRNLPVPMVSPCFADRAENAVQLLSRWAGITAFVGTVAAIIWLIF